MMNCYPMTVESTTVKHPMEPNVSLRYDLLPFPAGIGRAWSILAIEEENDCAMETHLLYDLTRDAKAARALFRLCARGKVLPQDLEEVFAEQEIL